MALKTDFRIEKISAIQAYAVRHPVLRPNKPIDSCVFESDHLKTTIHLGLFQKETLIGVATFIKNNSDIFKPDDQYQLRGMAILPEYRGLQLGNLLLTHGLQLLRDKNIALVWCNARQVAKNFYERNGFSAFGNSFIIPKVGPHYVMFRTL